MRSNQNWEHRPANNYLALAAKTSPSRRPGEKAKSNNIVEYPSLKMGMVIRCESALERIAAVVFEINPRVSEYYCQPPTCFIEVTKKNGKRGTISYTPDFISRINDRVIVTEVKSLEFILGIIKTNPQEWSFDGFTATHRSYSEYFSSLGMEFTISIPDLNGKLRMHNARILDQSLRRNIQNNESGFINLVSLLEKSKKISIRDAATVMDTHDPVIIYKMIAKGILHTDLNNSFLEHLDSTLVSLPDSDLKKMERTKKPIHQNEIQSIHLSSSTSDIEKGKDKFRFFIQNQHSLKNRTIQRHKLIIERAKENGIPPATALAPKNHLKGNRYPRLSPAVYSFLDTFIKEHWLVTAPKKRSLLYPIYYLQSRSYHPNDNPISKTSFYKKLNSLMPHKVAMHHKGRRGSNAEQPASLTWNRNIVSGYSLFDTTLDHHQVDCLIEVASDSHEKIRIRPYLSTLLDRSSNAVLSWHLDISSPSKSIVSILIRKTLRQWGRIPVSIRTDRGSDLVSNHVEDLLAHIGTERVVSSVSNGRYGGEVERSFGEFKQDFAEGLKGYTPTIANRREFDSSKDPSNLSVLSLEEFVDRTSKFICERNKRLHGERRKSPEQLVKDSIKNSVLAGIPYEEGLNFDLDTAVQIKHFSIDYRRGLLVSGRRYMNPHLQDHRIKKSDLEVRTDPENPCLVYVKINNEWTIATHKDLEIFEAYNDNEKTIYNLWISGGKNLRNDAKFKAKLRNSEILTEEYAPSITESLPALDIVTTTSSPDIEYDFNFDDRDPTHYDAKINAEGDSE